VNGDGLNDHIEKDVLLEAWWRQPRRKPPALLMRC
jgi:hypothetical protein